MECYYHPNRESTDICAICGKSICKECSLEIAGKTYCKDCLEKIVGFGIENKHTREPETVVNQEQLNPEPARLEKKPSTENIYKQPEEVIAPQHVAEPVHEIKQIHDDSPYKIREDSNYSKNVNPAYIQENEVSPQVPQNEPNIPKTNTQDFIYPDHSYEPQQNNAKMNLEDKYEKYLDDLYFDENEMPLGEQLAKDEEKFGSLTRRPYHPRSEEAIAKEQATQRKIHETPEEMEARIRAEILAEKEGNKKIKDGNIHNLNYQEENEAMNIVDIILTIILIIVILIVIYYIIFIIVLHTAYPTFMDALYALSNPQNVINNILTPQ